MGKSLIKDTLREIRRSITRWLSILAIVALGAAFYTGVGSASPDMLVTADRYLEESNLFDIRIVSTYGLNDDDVSAIRADGITEVMTSYSADMIISEDERSRVITFHDLPREGGMNRVWIQEGRLPEREDEIVVNSEFLKFSKFNIGDTVTLSDEIKDIEKTLKNTKYTITGTVDTPYYLSRELGDSGIGNGNIEGFCYCLKSNFVMEVYTGAFLTVNNPEKLSKFSDGYEDLLKPIKKALERVGVERANLRFSEIKADAQKELDDARAEVTDGERKRQEAVDGLGELNEASAELDKKQTELDKGKSDYEKGLAEWQSGKKKLEDAKRDIDSSTAELNTGKTALDGAQAELDANRALFGAEHAAISAGQAEIDKKRAELAAGQQKLNAGIAEYEAGVLELGKSEALLQDSRRQLDDGQALIDDGRKQILDNTESAQNGIKEADEKLPDAKIKIEDGQRELDKLKIPEWHVLDVTTNAGIYSYKSDTQKIAAIALVFPLIFFLVAALVTLTAMTRMIEEERTVIGTYKALGYNKFRIALKYFSYGLSACVLGIVLGIGVGTQFFPRVIFDAYTMLYVISGLDTPLNPLINTIAAVSSIFTLILATGLACYKELISVPASLMRPKAPKEGKIILLQRVKPLWNRLTFIQKVTVRNIFRYKKRFFMTLIGISGCTALLLTGFGLQDSITSIVGKQYREINIYDASTIIKDGMTDEDKSDLLSTLEDYGVSDTIFNEQRSVDLISGKKTQSGYMLIPSDAVEFETYISLHGRTSKKLLPLTDDGAVITEKTANILGVSAGDTIDVKDGDDVISIKITGISENYVYHFLYVSPALYKKTFCREPDPNYMLMNVPEATDTDALTGELLDKTYIGGMTWSEKMMNSFSDMVDKLGFIVVVLIISAGLLAFVVLFNLNSINIEERKRELATIKLLGFYNNEVASYIFRENVVLTVIGALTGLALGIFLHKFIVVTAEVDVVMFSRDINPLSYVYSVLLTLAFSFIVNTLMRFRLNGIKMADSLKSVE